MGRQHGDKNGRTTKRDALSSDGWTREEIIYCDRLKKEFTNGILPLAEGTALLTLLSDVLECEPARVSRRYGSIDGIVFHRRERVDAREIKRVCEELVGLKRAFTARIAQFEAPKRPVLGISQGYRATYNASSVSVALENDSSSSVDQAWPLFLQMAASFLDFQSHIATSSAMFSSSSSASISTNTNCGRVAGSKRPLPSQSTVPSNREQLQVPTPSSTSATSPDLADARRQWQSNLAKKKRSGEKKTRQPAGPQFRKVPIRPRLEMNPATERHIEELRAKARLLRELTPEEINEAKEMERSRRVEQKASIRDRDADALPRRGRPPHEVWGLLAAVEGEPRPLVPTTHCAHCWRLVKHRLLPAGAREHLQTCLAFWDAMIAGKIGQPAWLKL